MTTMPAQYYNRFDAAKEFEEHLFIAGRSLQSAELNEIQRSGANRLRGIADVLFKDGDIIRDASCQLNPTTGVAACQSGAIYLRGAVRGVAPATLTVPITGTHSIGIRLIETVITALEDPTLRDPATGTRNYDGEGAERLKVTATWGWDGDGSSAQFFPVYSLTNGILDAKEPPPNLDVMTQALAQYDRDSAGGSYVVSGLEVSRLADREDGYQVFTVTNGRARVNGYGVNITTSRRLARNAVPVTRFIDSEPRISTTGGSQRITTDRHPIANITQVRIIKEKTVTLNHGTVTGAVDPLPDTSVVSITSVVQGATTYTPTTDYLLTGGQVDWTPTGSEPAPGSSYNVTYRYLTTVVPTGVDATGFTITGAVSGTLVQTSYNAKLPRIDRLCLDDNGQFVWIEGVSTDYNPVRPAVPSNLLELAQVVQTWDASSYVINDGVRVVPMQDINGINARLDNLVQIVAQQNLVADAKTREATAKKGLFVDPFLNDSLRDQGLAQTAAIANGELVLAIDATVLKPSADVTAATTCAFTSRIALSQESRTGAMKINPFMAFSPLPAAATLTPAIDRWTQTVVTWASPITERFFAGAGFFASSTQNTLTQSQSTTKALANLRPIEVNFRLEGFGSGEILSSVTFDGLAVTPVAP